MPLADLSGSCGNVTARRGRRGTVIQNRPVNIPPRRTILPLTDLQLQVMADPTRLRLTWNCQEVHPNARTNVRRAIAAYQQTDWHAWQTDLNLTGQPVDASPCDSDELETGHSYLFRAWAEIPDDLQPTNAPPWLPSGAVHAVAHLEAEEEPTLHEHDFTLQDGLEGYAGTTDTWITDAPECINNGADTIIFVKGTEPYQRYGFVRFELPEISPAPTIIEASLNLTCLLRNTKGTGSATLHARPVIPLWGEGTGTLDPSEAGDLDAIHSQHDSVSWATQGAENIPLDTLDTEDSCPWPQTEAVATLNLLDSIAAHYAATRTFRGTRLHLTITGSLSICSIQLAARHHANLDKRPWLYVHYQHTH